MKKSGLRDVCTCVRDHTLIGIRCFFVEVGRRILLRSQLALVDDGKVELWKNNIKQQK